MPSDIDIQDVPRERLLPALRKRDAMVFPFRWFDTLQELSDSELRAMLAAMRDYAEKQSVPNFSGAMAALWREFQQRMDYDRGKYLAICDRNNRNGQKGGRPRKTQNNPKNPVDFLETQENPRKPKKPDAEADAEADKKETLLKQGKENASLFSLHEHEDGICQSSIRPSPNFKMWTGEQFTRSVDDAITERPEYAPYREAFLRYWAEPDGKGRPRFQLEKTWRTTSRLATWHERNTGTRRPGPQSDTPAEAAEVTDAEFDRAEKQREVWQ